MCGGVNVSAANSIAHGSYYSVDEEFKDFEDDEKMMDQDQTQPPQTIPILNNQQIIRGIP